jgi:hypothetical protein
VQRAKKKGGGGVSQSVSRSSENQSTDRPTDKYPIAYKSSHFTTGINREPLSQDELERISIRSIVVVVVFATSFKDRARAEVVHDEIRRFE